ncbi:hypothetical protein GGP41_001506 [Bipolaris sorokiniana]|uniref:Uncharacterized protein n=1 Tax=Cochliobolus sativus TaxID=45130 RepID=A0A8H5ZPU0_COCSA|nr:hypothetical protein GGP41_001506 [Bipolaris sorokiniana]
MPTTAYSARPFEHPAVSGVRTDGTFRGLTWIYWYLTQSRFSQQENVLWWKYSKMAQSDTST